MANRMWDDQKTLGKGRVILSGSFQPNGASAITSKKGQGFSVTRTGPGAINVQFLKGDGVTAEKFYDKICAVVELQENAIGTNIAKLKSFDPVAGLAVIATATFAAPTVPADIANNANNWIHFNIQVQVSSVGK